MYIGNIFKICKKVFLDFISHEDVLLQALEKEPETYWNNLLQPKEVHNVLTFFSYESPSIKKAIWEIKYKNNDYFKDILCKMAGETLASSFEDDISFLPEQKVFFIPIPAHPLKQKEKGFNQSEEITRTLETHFPLAHQLLTGTLIKVKNTKPQATLKRTARLQNMKNAFEVSKPELVKNKTIVLVDDVVTTGSTLLEAKNTLLEAGAQEVHMVALSRGG